MTLPNLLRKLMVGQFANWSLRQFVFFCKKGWLLLGVVGKGPCQVVEGDGGGPEGAGPIERS